MRLVIIGLATIIFAAGLPAAIAQIQPSDEIQKQLNRLQPHAGNSIDPTTGGIGAPKPHPTAPSGNTSSPVAKATHPGENHLRPAAVSSLACGDGPAEGADSNLDVLFAAGSSTLAPEGIAQLNELANALNGEHLLRAQFCIEGYTDTVGGTGYNKLLSEQRAASVVDFLMKSGHVSADRLKAVGFGKTHLLVPTADQTPEPKNRRVRVVNLGVMAGS